MPEFISLTCPSCETNLKIHNDINRFACGNCGNEFLLKRESGIIYLQKIEKVVAFGESNLEIDTSLIQKDEKELPETINKTNASEPTIQDVNTQSDDDSIINKIDNKITQLNEDREKCTKKRKKINIIIFSSSALLLIASLIYLVINATEKLSFSEVATFFIPILFLMIVYLIINYTTTYANLKYIDSRIKKTTEERDLFIK